MTESLEIIKEFKLDNYLKIVIQKSTSNKAPYHNFFHVLCMVKNVYKIALSEGLLPKAIRPLLIAALFHDFNHSMGAHNDEWNVNEAISMFMLYSQEDAKTNKLVVSIIRATQYPYVVEEEDLTLEQKIIRDADLLQQYESNYLQQVYYGLSEELNTTFEILLQGYPVFIKGMKLHTDCASQICEELSVSRDVDVAYLTDLLSEKPQNL